MIKKTISKVKRNNKISELPILSFETIEELRKWYEKHHETHKGFWFLAAKKNSDRVSVSGQEALDEALCFGWIDGVMHAHDEQSFLKHFTRRTPRSIWSKINQANIERLITSGRMHEAGLAAVQAAKEDGRWDQAYASPSTAVIPDDFLSAVQADRLAAATFSALNKSNKYAIYFRLTTAKRPETRAKRFESLMEMLRKGEKIH